MNILFILFLIQKTKKIKLFNKWKNENEEI